MATTKTNGGYDCYLASGWFNDYQRDCLKAMRGNVLVSKLKAYDPELMCQCPPDAKADFATYVLNENIAQINEAKFVYASIACRDLGTLFEVGLAVSLGKQILFYDGDVTALQLMATDFAAETLKRTVQTGSQDAVVIDTTGKDPVSVAAAGYAYANGARIIYYAPGLPEGAQFNLMLAKSGIAVATTAEDLEHCVSMAKDLNWTRPYTGLIE